MNFIDFLLVELSFPRVQCPDLASFYLHREAHLLSYRFVFIEKSVQDTFF